MLKAQVSLSSKLSHSQAVLCQKPGEERSILVLSGTEAIALHPRSRPPCHDARRTRESSLQGPKQNILQWKPGTVLGLLFLPRWQRWLSWVPPLWVPGRVQGPQTERGGGRGGRCWQPVFRDGKGSKQKAC